jgi:nucleotide-binding universal stress UspA family protein
VDVVERPVAVGIDGSPASLGAVAAAAREAALRGRPLRLVHADWWAADPAWVDTDPAGSLAVELRTDPERIVKEALSYAATIAGTPVTAEVVPGDPGAVLAAQSRTACLVVVAHRGAGGFLGLSLGSVAIAVAARATCPVLVVRGTAAADGYLAVGVDGSPANQAAVAFAFEEAALRDARLIAVHSWLGPVSTGPGDMLPVVSDPAVLRERAEAVLAQALARWSRRHPGVCVERRTVRSRATTALVSASAAAQLIVVGTHGHRRRPVLPFGSVTHALVQHSACPIVVVPPAAGRDDDGRRGGSEMKAKAGDRIVLAGAHVGDGERIGVVTEVRGSDGGPPYLVRWLDNGHETLCFPGTDARVQAGAGPST